MADKFSPYDYEFDKELARSYLTLLTPTEREVLSLRCERKKYREIAEILVVTQKDVEYHLGNIYTKLKLDLKELGYNERFYILATFFCPILREMMASETRGEIVPWKPEEKIPSRDALIIVSQETDGEKFEDEGTEVIKIDTGGTQLLPPGPTGRNWWRIIAIVVSIFSIGVIIYLATLPPVEKTVIQTVIVTQPPEEVAQVFPPTVIPTGTFTPMITNTATSNPTETITPAPTIAPTPVRIGTDNLPLKFEGTMTQSYFGTFPMIFYIEERNGDRVSGKTHYPELYNLIYGWEGEIVHDFGDITEESKWMKLEAYGSEGGTWIKEKRRWNIQGTNSATDGNYYLFISDTGKVTGNWFRWNNVEPGPPFTLNITDNP